jgi:hypothetical protein
MPAPMVLFYDRMEARAADEKTRRVIRGERDFMDAQAAVTAVGAVVILATTAALTALIAPSVVQGDDIAARAFLYTIGQWPAVAAMIGCTTLLTGVMPRLIPCRSCRCEPARSGRRLTDRPESADHAHC